MYAYHIVSVFYTYLDLLYILYFIKVPSEISHPNTLGDYFSLIELLLTKTLKMLLKQL